MSSGEFSITSHSLDSPEGTIQGTIGAGMPTFEGGEGMDEDSLMIGSMDTARSSRRMSWPSTGLEVQVPSRRFPNDSGMSMSLMDSDEATITTTNAGDGMGESGDAETEPFPSMEFDSPHLPTRRWSFPIRGLEDSPLALTTNPLNIASNGVLASGLLETEEEVHPVVFVIPTDYDVLFGQSRNLRAHPGNQRLRALVAEHFQRYENCTKLEKTELCKMIVQTIYQEGGRLLRQPEQKSVTDIMDAQWIEIEDIEKGRERITSRFRDYRSRIKDKAKYDSNLRRLQDHNHEGAGV